MEEGGDYLMVKRRRRVIRNHVRAVFCETSYIHLIVSRSRGFWILVVSSKADAGVFRTKTCSANPDHVGSCVVEKRKSLRQNGLDGLLEGSALRTVHGLRQSAGST